MALRSLSAMILSEATLAASCPRLVFARSKFRRARVLPEYYVERSEDHERYGGEPDQPHKLHIVTRVKSTMRRPYWEKDMVKLLGLQKAHTPVIHKNTPTVNGKLQSIKHLVRIQPLRTPNGLPGEQDMANTYINTKGELIVQRLLKPVDPNAIES